MNYESLFSELKQECNEMVQCYHRLDFNFDKTLEVKYYDEENKQKYYTYEEILSHVCYKCDKIIGRYKDEYENKDVVNTLKERVKYLEDELEKIKELLKMNS